MSGAPTPAPAPEAALDPVLAQRHTLRVLVTSQVLGGIGVSSGIAVGGLLARSLLPSDALAGLAQAAVTLGAAGAALPIARLMADRGRRPGLVAAYLAAALGALIALVGAGGRSFGLVVAGMLVFGCGTAANLQARYAAADLAPIAHRARALAVVVWATTVGAVLGPNLAAPVDAITTRWQVPAYGGPFLLSAVGFALAALVVFVRLRPDPLVLAGGTGRAGGRGAGGRHSSLRPALSALRRCPDAALGLTASTIGQIVMVAVMTMTPLQLRHAGHAPGHELQIVGLVISVHVLGMYALSPAVGLADRWGRRPLIAAGALVLLAGTALAGTAAAEATVPLTAGLFLLGVGWNATLVGGSALIVDAVPTEARAGVQGVADALMTGAGGLGGAASGLAMVRLGYGGLNLVAAGFVLALLALLALPVLLRMRRRDSHQFV